MEVDRSRGYQESKKVRKLKNNKNNRKFIGNVKIVIQGSLKTESLVEGRNLRDQSCPVVILTLVATQQPQRKIKDA